MVSTMIKLFFGLITACSVAYGLKRDGLFVRNPAMDDKRCPPTERVGSSSTRSAMTCGHFCQRLAQTSYSFFYNKATKACYCCDRTYNQGSPTLEAGPGMTYFGPVHLAVTCKDLFDAGAPSGVYHLLTPSTATPISVRCDMETQGGGWMVWQIRYDGSESFGNRPFSVYDQGFGKPDGEYWLGLKYLREYLTSRPSDVYLQFTDFADDVVYEMYEDFRLSVYPQYTLTFERLISANDSCTGGSYGLGFNYGKPFSTQDNVQNNQPICPQTYLGGWWYGYCTRLNVNGAYGALGLGGGVYMYNMEWHGYDALKGSKLMTREI